ncbi:MAG: hypothetical protein EOO14_04990, partial [Chitinophagaceae bacterium]
MGKGIAYRSEAKVAFIDMAAAPGVSDGYSTEYGKAKTPLKSTVPDDMMVHMPWSPWGSNNLFAQDMIKDIESCGILNGIINTRARFALGEGPVPAITERDPKTGQKVVKEWVNDPAITDFLEANNYYFQTFGWMQDLMGFGNGVGRFMLNGAYDKIVAFRRDDVTEMRYAKKDASGKINHVFLSAQWDKIISPNDNSVLKVPLLDEVNPLLDLQTKAAKKIAEHAFTFRYPGWGKHYYSTPLWYSAYKWVKIAQGVPEMKAALYENSMRIKYLVTIYPKYWEDAFPGQWDGFTADQKEEKRNQLFDEINDYLCGAKNAHKSLFVDGVYDAINGKQYSTIDIKPIEDTSRDGELLPDSAAANSEIAFSMLFNPAIIGASLPSGPYT